MHWFNVFWNWVETKTGTHNESGPFYAWWSGFGSDIGEVAIIGGLVQIYRQHNCHVKGCPRLSKHDYAMNGVTYKLCRVHHPNVDETKAVKHEDFLAHAKRQKKAVA